MLWRLIDRWLRFRACIDDRLMPYRGLGRDIEAGRASIKSDE